MHPGGGGTAFGLAVSFERWRALQPCTACRPAARTLYNLGKDHAAVGRASLCTVRSLTPPATKALGNSLAHLCASPFPPAPRTSSLIFPPSSHPASPSPLPLAPAAAPDFAVRLADGDSPASGRLEVYWRGAWGTVWWVWVVGAPCGGLRWMGRRIVGGTMGVWAVIGQADGRGLGW